MTTQAANPRTNPDGLPVGLSKTVTTEGKWKGEQVGLTCAACHNTQLTFKGKKIRIDGGAGNTFDLMAYIYALDDALQATLTDTAKFDRLATHVGASAPDAERDLRKRFESEAERVHLYRTRTLVTPYPWGPARMDAIGLIVNRLTSIEAGIPENWSTPLAPTKPPFLWNAPQGSWTQWRGTQQDPIGRNLTETMGVFMSMDLTSKTPEEGLFDSNAALPNLEKIENALSRLAPPKWPEDILGKIDRKKAAAGKVLFAANCASCHNSYPYTWTAANKVRQALHRGGPDTRFVCGHRSRAVRGPAAIRADQSARQPMVAGAVQGCEGHVANRKSALRRSAEADPGRGAGKAAPLAEAEAAVCCMAIVNFRCRGRRAKPIYKAAPRDGVWATPPFMHNGSVPNLYEMLLPAKERTKKFYLGREFDTVKVGLDTSGNSGKYLDDTSLRGSSNRGHSFENGPLGNGIIGPLLTDAGQPVGSWSSI